MEKAGLSYRVASPDEIFTNVTLSSNLKVRTVYCQYCKFQIDTDMQGAQCKKCNSDLITYIAK